MQVELFAFINRRMPEISWIGGINTCSGSKIAVHYYEYVRRDKDNGNITEYRYTIESSWSSETRDKEQH